MNSLENGALYAVLYYRGDATSWHWSLFLPDPATSPIGADGTLFQVSDSASVDLTTATAAAAAAPTTTPTRWHYDCAPGNILQFPRTILCVKLGDVRLLGTYSDAAEWLDNTLKAVPVVPNVFVDRQSYMCRAWFLAAVADLHDLGILSCHNITMLEQEIQNRAVLATMSFTKWGGTTVCIAKHCS